MRQHNTSPPERGVRKSLALARWREFGALVAALALGGSAAAQTSSPRWAGMVNEAYMLETGEVWTVEDGGRIRHRDAGGTWAFQETPPETPSTLRRVFARDFGGRIEAYAVGIDGWVLQKLGPAAWSAWWRQPESATGLTGFADLWDFGEDENGVLYSLGLHGIWRNAGHQLWPKSKFWDSTDPLLRQEIDPARLELYAFDFAPDGTALASAQPGLIFRRIPGLLDEWEQVFDIRSMCGPESLQKLHKCAADRICESELVFEPWDLELSRNSTSPLAIVVGGVGTGCGVILASVDNGATWSTEPHECQCSFGGCIPCSGPPPLPPHPDYTNNGGAGELWRHRTYRELYNVAIFHADNTAIASGYAGQIVVREPADPLLPGAQPLWRDRSQYSSETLTTPDAVTLPGFGVVTSPSTAPSGVGYAVSMGGYIRTTADSGQSWSRVPFAQNPIQPGPWRMRDVVFRNSLDGWMVGQFHRIERTTNGGTDWSPDDSDADYGKGLLNAAALDGTGQIGVAVGQSEASPSGFPAILFERDLNTSTPGWESPDPSNLIPAVGFTGSPEFLDVDWASGLEFWAVGRSGLIVHSDPVQGLDLWHQFVPLIQTPSGPMYADLQDFDIDGVSFASSLHGLVVGTRTPGGVQTAKAYHVDRTTTPIDWSEITIPNEPNLVALTDVDFDGVTAYATGIRNIAGVKHGVVLRATMSAGVFSNFVATSTAFDACTLGDAADAVNVLTEVEIAPGGAVWIGGQCGRLWRSADGATWSSVRSYTDAHIQGMSFAASDTGFAVCHRANRTGNNLMRIAP